MYETAVFAVFLISARSSASKSPRESLISKPKTSVLHTPETPEIELATKHAYSTLLEQQSKGRL